MYRIALVDDDLAVLDLLKRSIESHGYKCLGFSTGEQFYKSLRTDTFDLLILDWTLPDTSGPEVIQRLRMPNAIGVPIIMLTNRSEEKDVVRALNIGADGYMVKPVRINELVMRVNALFRRTHSQDANQIQYKQYLFDFRLNQVWSSGQLIDVTNKEFALAAILFRNLGRVMSRTHLLNTIWSYSSDANTRTLDTHIHKVRVALNLKAENGYRIVSVYGIGYRLEDVDHLTTEPSEVTNDENLRSSERAAL